jgi:hypothetical protein
VLVLKQGRGTGGTGVWKVWPAEPQESSNGRIDAEALVRVQHAATRDTTTDEMPLTQFLQQCRGYFAWSGFLVDQPFQERLPDGMIRAYLTHDQVVGFCHQWPTGLLGPDQRSHTPPPTHVMEDPDTPVYQPLRKALETEWIPQMTSLLELDRTDLPVIWDADFLFGSTANATTERYVLCEINVSAVWPYPLQATNTIAEAAAERIRSNKAARG